MSEIGIRRVQKPHAAHVYPLGSVGDHHFQCLLHFRGQAHVFCKEVRRAYRQDPHRNSCAAQSSRHRPHCPVAAAGDYDFGPLFQGLFGADVPVFVQESFNKHGGLHVPACKKRAHGLFRLLRLGFGGVDDEGVVGPVVLLAYLYPPLPHLFFVLFPSCERKKLPQRPPKRRSGKSEEGDLENL